VIATLNFGAGETFVVDVARGPDDRAVPMRQHSPWSGESYVSGDGTSYVQFDGWEVLLKARIATDCADDDGDGVCAFVDNCPNDDNASQVDSDDDGYGDACDECPNDASNDGDGDGICANVDNCLDVYNPSQLDVDGTAVGDACECNDARLIFTEDGVGDYLGWRVAGAGDVNNDGYDDLITGARFNDEIANNAGKAFVYSGLTGRLLMELTGEAATDNFGQTVCAAGDVNNDGYDDVIVGAYGCDLDGTNAGRAYVFHGGPGPFPENRSATDADLIFPGEAALDNMGFDVAGLGDIDGDNCSDIIVVAAQRGAELEGKVYVYSGQTGSRLYTYTGEYPNDWFGYGAANSGDVNDDGLDDVVVGAFSNDVNGSSSGSVYIFYSSAGPYPIDRNAADADMIFAGNTTNHALGSSVAGAGDINDDNHDDIIVGAYFLGSGYAYIYSGFDGSVLLTLSGETSGDRFAWSVAGLNDVNADGVPDVAVGAPKASSGANMTGRAYVFSGQTGEVLKVVDGEAYDDRFGRDVYGAGDANGDGVEDLVVGAFQNAAAGEDAGRAYLFHLGYDADGDNVLAGCDNCAADANADQADADGDGLGDVCDNCCQFRVGDANGLGGDEPTIGDVSVMIDAKFITGTCEGILECYLEADVNLSGGLGANCDDITIGDISTLIDYLFITGSSLGLADCL
jgi:hypothetical protein